MVSEEVLDITFGFFPSLANKARNLSCEGGATNIIYGFKSELRSVFSDCRNSIYLIFNSFPHEKGI